MFRKLDIPIIGVIQNMSSVICPKCQSKVCLHSDSAEAAIKGLSKCSTCMVLLTDELFYRNLEHVYFRCVSVGGYPFR